jgi:sugar phosphate isomerase/epimerase
MNKLSIAIAGENALPSAFVVFRGFEKSIPRAAELGFQGVELALKSVSEINSDKIDALLSSNGLEISCISTGHVYADTGFMFTDSDQSRRKVLKKTFEEFIDLASHYGRMVNIGRVRGNLVANDNGDSEKNFIELAYELGQYAGKRDVTLVVEPVNRYELNFVNSVEQGALLIKKIGLSNIKLMPDVFHMNIEDVTIGGELEKNIEDIAYIHFADSNRYAPGWGHTDFESILRSLKRASYQGWCSVEIFPVPDADAAARQAALYLLPLIKKHLNG